jgi:hypothetical protein
VLLEEHPHVDPARVGPLQRRDRLLIAEYVDLECDCLPGGGDLGQDRVATVVGLDEQMT